MPSALSMSNANQLQTPDGGDLGTTMGQAGSMASQNLALRQRYDEPTVFRPITDATQREALRDAGLNPDEPLPARYDAPSAAKERLQRRHEILRWYNNASGEFGNLQKNMNVGTDEEIALLESAEERKQLAEFDEYVAKLIDPKKPGNLQWLMNIYPEYVHRRIAQIHADHKYALDNTMIEAWGVNTFEDLFMKFMIDNKRLDGPSLGRRKPTSYDAYKPGWLSVFRDANKRAGAADNYAVPFSRDFFRMSGPAGDRSAYQPYSNLTESQAVRGRGAFDLGRAPGGNMMSSILGGPGGARRAATGNSSTQTSTGTAAMDQQQFNQGFLQQSSGQGVGPNVGDELASVFG